jgi:hypothetical protein
VLPFSGIAFAPKLAVMPAIPTTVIVDEALSPDPPSFELIAEVKLLFVPTAVAVTFTLIEQAALAGIFPPLKPMKFELATALSVPLQVLVNAFGLATARPLGSASVKVSPVNGSAFGFAI